MIQFALPLKLRLVVEFDPSTKRYSVVFPEIPGIGEVDPVIGRMRKGLKLNSKLVSREEAHERHPLL